MSKQTYDVTRITKELFDRWYGETLRENHNQQTGLAPRDRRLIDAARVPEPPSAADLECGLLSHIHEGCTSTYPVSRAWLTSSIVMLEEILAARAREAEEADGE